jgi:ATP-dependent DNA ligase
VATNSVHLMPIALSSSGGTYTVASSAGMFFAARNPASVAVAVVGNADRTTPEAFDHRACVFEPKLDGFRALAVVRGHRCELVSRHGHVFRSWPQLAEEVAHAVRAHSAVLDGEIICVGADGKPRFLPADVPARMADLLRLRRARD